MMPEKIEVLLIENRHGTVICPCVDEATAEAVLLRYVTVHWDASYGPIPADPKEAVESYFDIHGPEESYVLSAEKVITAATAEGVF